MDGKLRASGFIQKKANEIKTSKITPDPVVKLPNAYEICITEPDEKKLSEIIDEINARTGKNFNTDVAKRIAIQIRDLMKKNEDLRNSAKNNSEKTLSSVTLTISITLCSMLWRKTRNSLLSSLRMKISKNSYWVFLLMRYTRA